MSDDVETSGKKAALQHILKKFVPKAKKVRLMGKVKPEVDHSKMYDDEEPQDMEKLEDNEGDDDLLERLLAKLDKDPDAMPED